MKFWKFIVHEFFEIHGPSTFWNSMSQRFLRLWAIKQASPGRRGRPYYMIFHYQKVTVLNYLLCHEDVLDTPKFLKRSTVLSCFRQKITGILQINNTLFLKLLLIQRYYYISTTIPAILTYFYNKCIEFQATKDHHIC